MEFISSDEAAEVLGLSSRQFRRLVHQGLIQPHGPPKAPGRTASYDANEVAALARIREDNLSLATVAVRAEMALLKVRQLERAVRRLSTLVDIRSSIIELDEESVRSLHLRVEDELRDVIDYSPHEVLEWAKTFYAIGEEYFQAVERHLGLTEPWEKYIDLSIKILGDTPVERLRSDLDLRTALEAFKQAQTSMRQAAFFFAQAQRGQREAYRIFPAAAGDMHEDIVSLALELYPNKRD